MVAVPGAHETSWRLDQMESQTLPNSARQHMPSSSWLYRRVHSQPAGPTRCSASSYRLTSYQRRFDHVGSTRPTLSLIGRSSFGPGRVESERGPGKRPWQLSSVIADSMGAAADHKVQNLGTWPVRFPADQSGQRGGEVECIEIDK